MGDTLLSYRLIELSRPDSVESLPPVLLRQEVTDFLGEINNEPVELQGRSSLGFLFLAFSLLYPKSNELVYRETPTGRGTLIFSRLDDAQFLRPYDIDVPDYDGPEPSAALPASSETIGEIDLKREWDLSGQRLNLFLAQIMALSHHSKQIVTTGTILPTPALLALRILLSQAESVSFENLNLGQS